MSTRQIGIPHDILLRGNIIRSTNLPYLSALISMVGSYFLSVVTRYNVNHCGQGCRVFNATEKAGALSLIWETFVVATGMCGMS